MSTFRLECGCHLSLEEDGLNEPCLVHEHEQITPLEAMVMVFRTRLMEDTPQEALAFIQRKRDELNDGKPVARLSAANDPGHTGQQGEGT